MLKCIADCFSRLKQESCYNKHEYVGYAAFGSCGGISVTNDTKTCTDKLCIDCPHYVYRSKKTC